MFQEYKKIDFSQDTEVYPSRFEDQKLEFEKRLNYFKKLDWSDRNHAVKKT